MRDAVEVAMEQIRPELIARGCDVELLSTTKFGVVRVNLSGECCSGRLQRLLTILAIEDEIKRQVPGVKIVMEGAHAEDFS